MLGIEALQLRRNLFQTHSDHDSGLLERFFDWMVRCQADEVLIDWFGIMIVDGILDRIGPMIEKQVHAAQSGWSCA